MTAKKLPVGIENFEEIRKQDFYYVDKTGLIVDLLASWGKVNLFTRPRRFGKTLNMSMLKCFFEIGGDKSIFEGLTISRENALCETYMGKYPVVFVSLKGVDGLTFKDVYERLRVVIRSEAFRLGVLRDSTAISSEEKSAYIRIIEEKDTSSDIVDSLKMLCILLEKHYGQKVILLIDEYFGFTDAEVGKMLADYGLESHHAEARAWYDGYRFGGQDVYCPWDVINYCYALRASENAKPKAYWMNTSGNDMVRRLISKGTDGTTQVEIERLIAGETITKTLNENLTHNEIDANIGNIWSLLYMTGYLTVADYPDGNRYELKIPNYEVRQIFTQQVLEWFNDKARAETDKLSELSEAFETGDVTTITEFLNSQLLDTVSFYDAHESFYHGFLLALLSTCANWRVSSNAETGKGRSDIIVERKDRKIGFVVEVKDVKDEGKLDNACEVAMKQIEEKDYTAILRRYRVKEIWTYGIAFWDKECRVAAKCIAQ